MITKEAVLAAIVAVNKNSMLSDADIITIQDAFCADPMRMLIGGSQASIATFSFGVEIGRVMMAQELGMRVQAEAAVGVRDTP